MFVVWYCHKRGREVRLEKEKSMSGGSRVEELPDDAETAEGSNSNEHVKVTPPDAGPDLPPPPIGEHAPGRKSPVIEKK
jgi:hypothetical protein